VSLAPAYRVPSPIEIGAWRLRTSNSLRKHGISPPQCVSGCLIVAVCAASFAFRKRAEPHWHVYSFSES
jgi:hypothetical protein